MKGLKKVALASAIAAVSAGAQAELKALDDAAMGELTGQAGLTIDLETQLSIGEFAYVDAGAVVFRDIYRGGKDDAATGARTLLDNIRLTLDVADGTESFNYGMSEVRSLAGFHAVINGNGTAGMAEAAAGTDTLAGGTTGTALIDDKRVAGDGDLVLHFGFTDAWEKGGGFVAYASGLGSDGAGGTADFTTLEYSAARDIASRAVDFQFEIGQIALATSGFGAGMYDETTGWAAYSNGRIGEEVISKQDRLAGVDTDTETNTTLISDLKMAGYLGPMDIIIENNGNGFGADGSGLGGGVGTGNADSKIIWDSFVKVTDLDLYIDIAGVQLKDIRIHNERGDTTSLNQIDDGTGTLVNTSSFGFAHSKREIFAVKDTVLNLELALTNPNGLNPATGGLGGPFFDGIAINTRFKGDLDIGHLSFGNTDESIGQIYLTDIESTTNWTISAH